MKNFLGLLTVWGVLFNAYAADTIMFQKSTPNYFPTNEYGEISFSFNVAPAKINCHYEPTTILSEKNADNITSVTKNILCEDKAIPGRRFTNLSCQEAINCRKSLAETENEKALIDAQLKQVVAKDYVKNILKKGLPEIERFEMLKAFAQKKKSAFGLNTKQSGEQCSSTFEVSDQCNLKPINTIFNEEQSHCSVMNVGCYYVDEAGIKGVKSFKQDFKESNDAKNFISTYGKYRVENKIKKQQDDEKDYIDKLASLVSSNDFKAANSDKKAEMFANFLNSSATIDPVLSYDLPEEVKSIKAQDVKANKSIVALYESKKITKESFKKEFDSYRKKRVQEVLGTSTGCSGKQSMEKICIAAAEIASPQGVHLRSEESVEEISSQNLANPEAVEKIKKILGKRFKGSYFEKLLDAQRCESFGILKPSQLDADGSVKILPPKRTVEDDYKDEITRRFSKPNTDWLGDSSGRLGASSMGIASIRESSRFGSEAEGSSSASAVSQASVPDVASSTQATATNTYSNNYSDLYRPSSYNPEEKEKDKEKPLADYTPSENNSSIEGKLSDLNKRLADSEAKVEKLKAENDQAKADLEKEKELQKEKDLVSELKNQITDLKAQNVVAKKTAAVNKAVQAQEAANAQNAQPTTVINNNYGANPSRVETLKPSSRVDNYIPEARDYDAAGKMAGAGVGRSAGAISALTLTSTGIDKNGVSLVVLTIDGMSAEKAAEAISSRIIELKGMPFYVEEAGMMKEIIPVMKDGKLVLDEKGNPVFEKITKGKAKDKKFANVKDKGRAPAAITNAADLKRADEANAARIQSRAEYEKLKALTNGIVDEGDK
jgi:nucleoside diphosphate kinase